MLKVKRLKGGLERLVLLGMITDTPFLDKIQTIIDKKAFTSIASKIICTWVLEYYEVYNTAPNRDIQIIWDQKSEQLHEDEHDLVQELLAQLSDEMDRRGEDFSCDFALQQAVRFFQQKQMEASVEELQDLLDDSKVEEAKELLLNIDLLDVEDEQIASTNILTDVDTLRTGFEDAETPLIFFPNALGVFINRLMVRKGFVAILAPEKRGKTWMLNEIALQALRQKRNVAYFNCGDLDNEEQAVRFAVRLARQSNLAEHCGTFYSPVLDCKWNQDNSCNRKDRQCQCGIGGLEITEPEDIEMAPPDYVSCRVCCGDTHFRGAVWYKQITIAEPLDWREALQINKKFLARYRITESNFRMRSYPADTFGLEDLDKTLEKWALEDGFTPDVILMDYIDIAATDSKLIGTRHTENHKWKRARAVCQKWNALFVTATQADGKAYDQETLHESNFSEDKRKYSHVTGFLTLNQTAEEAVLGRMRIGRMMTRNMKRTNAQITILQNLQRGLVHLGSFYT